MKKISFLLVLLVSLASLAPALGADSSGWGKVYRPPLEQDVVDLGDASPGVRKRAANLLWSAGDEVVPLLQRALHAGNPQIAAGAKDVLEKIEMGFTPSTNEIAHEALEDFEDTDIEDKKANDLEVILECDGGPRIVMWMWKHETGSVNQRRIAGAMTQRAVFLQTYLGKHDQANFDKLLQQDMDLNYNRDDDYIVYWMSKNQLQKKLALYESRLAAGEGNTRDEISLLYRADVIQGDRAGALAYAHRDNNGLRIHEMEFQTADWKDIANDELALLAKHEYMGGDDIAWRLTGHEDIIKKMLDSAVRVENWGRAPTVGDGVPGGFQCFNDRIADGLDQMEKAWRGYEAARLLLLQLRYADALKQLDNPHHFPLDQLRLQALTASVHLTLGQKDAAVADFQQAFDANTKVHDLDTWITLCQIARRLHRQDKADACVTAAIGENPSRDAHLAALLAADGIEPPMFAMRLTASLIDRNHVTAVEAVDTVRKLFAGTFGADQTVALIKGLYHGMGDADTLSAYALAMDRNGAKGESLKMYENHTALWDNHEAWMEMGDRYAQMNRWPDAVKAYTRACLKKPEDYLAAFLEGYAMTRGGNAAGGNKQMDFAGLLALGNTYEHKILADAARARGLTDRADHEATLAARLGNFSDQLPGWIQEELQRKDYVWACRHEQQALCNDGFDFPRDAAIAAADLHYITAMADFATKQPDAAMSEAKLGFADNPSDERKMIMVVRAADDAGDAKQGDALFALADSAYSQAAAEYPDSAALLCQSAWFEARCRRKLDIALANAAKAETLEPNDPDTLEIIVEAQYQQTHFKEAIATAQKCIALDPENPNHRWQLARCQLALKTGVADNQ